MRRVIAVVSFAVVVSLLLSLQFSASVMAATEQAKQLAINKGLDYLAKTILTFDADEKYWGYSSSDGYLAATGSAVLAFIEQGYLPGNDVIIDIGSGPVNYGDILGPACNYLFNRLMIQSGFGVEMSGQPYSGPGDTSYEHFAEDYNNDLNYSNDGGNNQALFFNNGIVSRGVYSTGVCTPVVFALGEALGPDTVIGRGNPPVNTMTYRQAMRDIIDWFSFAQVEPNRGVYRGGWRYQANETSSDNSTAQWGALPLLYGESWGLPVPAYVKNELEMWVNYIQYMGANASIYGSSGYTSPGDGYTNVSKTGGLLLELAAIGKPLSYNRVQAALGYLNLHWNENATSTWYGNFNHPYAMWAIYKGLDTYGFLQYYGWSGPGEDFLIGISSNPGNNITNALGGFTIGHEISPQTSLAGDWYSHYCNYLVSIQNANGSWNGLDYWTGALAIGWYINILNAAGSPPPINPLALVKSDGLGVGQTAYIGGTITYTISYNNLNNEYPVSDVVLTDFLPDEVTFVSASDGGTYEAGDHKVTWDIGSLAENDPGGTRQVVVTVKSDVDPGTTIKNDSIIASNETGQTSVSENTLISGPEIITVYEAWQRGLMCLYAGAFDPVANQYMYISSNPNDDEDPLAPWTGFYATIFGATGVDLLIPDEDPTAVSGPLTFDLGAGINYYLIAPPLLTASTSINANFGDDFPPGGGPEVSWRVVKWNHSAQAYQIYTADNAFMALAPGRGFFIQHITGVPQQLDIDGSEVTTVEIDGTQYYEINLPSNGGAKTFHMTGNPYAHNMFWQNCMVRVPMADPAPPMAKVAVDPGTIDTWYLGVKLESLENGLKDTYNRAGLVVDSPMPADAFCLTDMAPPGDYLRIALRDPDNADRPLYAYDFRAGGAHEYRWEIVLSTTVSTIDARLVLDNLAAVPEGWTISLKDMRTGAVVPITDDYTCSLSLSSGTTTTYLLTVSGQPTGVADQEATPVQFGISGVYPNPFNPATTIQYTLAASGQTKVSVYNLSGQLIETLVNEHLTAGVHTVVWDASRHAAGLYFIVLDSNGRQEARKVTFVK